MKVFLLVLCTGLYLNTKSQNKDVEIGYYIGKWKATPDSSTSSKRVLIFFVDRETVEMTFDTTTFRLKYTMALAKDSSILTLIGDKVPTEKIVLVPLNKNTFHFNSIENHRRNLVAKNTKPGHIAWGWSNPAPIKFERQ